MRTSKQYIRRREMGKCNRCGADSPDFTNCADCRKQLIDRYASRKASRVCTKCGKANVSGDFTRCIACRTQHRPYRQTQKRNARANQRCTDCGRPSGEFSRCKPCRHKRRLYKLRRLEQGIPRWRA